MLVSDLKVYADLDKKKFVGLQFQQQTLVDLCDSRNKLWKEFCFTQSKGGGVVIRDEWVIFLAGDFRRDEWILSLWAIVVVVSEIGLWWLQFWNTIHKRHHRHCRLLLLLPHSVCNSGRLPLFTTTKQTQSKLQATNKYRPSRILCHRSLLSPPHCGLWAQKVYYCNFEIFGKLCALDIVLMIFDDNVTYVWSRLLMLCGFYRI